MSTISKLSTSERQPTSASTFSYAFGEGPSHGDMLNQSDVQASITSSVYSQLLVGLSELRDIVAGAQGPGSMTTSEVSGSSIDLESTSSGGHSDLAEGANPGYGHKQGKFHFIDYRPAASDYRTEIRRYIDGLEPRLVVSKEESETKVGGPTTTVDPERLEAVRRPVKHRATRALLIGMIVVMGFLVQEILLTLEREHPNLFPLRMLTFGLAFFLVVLQL